jgi:hypothetical protein
LACAVIAEHGGSFDVVEGTDATDGAAMLRIALPVTRTRSAFVNRRQASANGSDGGP